MRKTIILVASLIALNSFANEMAMPTECTTIAAQCETAGFHAKEHKTTGKGLWADCIQNVATGKPVTGVTATKEEATACLAAHKAIVAPKKAAKAAKAAGTTTTPTETH